MVSCRGQFRLPQFAALKRVRWQFAGWLLSGTCWCTPHLPAQTVEQAAGRSTPGIPSATQDVGKLDPGSTELKSRVASLIEQLGDPSFHGAMRLNSS